MHLLAVVLPDLLQVELEEFARVSDVFGSPVGHVDFELRRLGKAHAEDNRVARLQGGGAETGAAVGGIHPSVSAKKEFPAATLVDGQAGQPAFLCGAGAASADFGEEVNGRIAPIDKAHLDGLIGCIGAAVFNQLQTSRAARKGPSDSGHQQDRREADVGNPRAHGGILASRLRAVHKKEKEAIAQHGTRKACLQETGRGLEVSKAVVATTLANLLKRLPNMP